MGEDIEEAVAELHIALDAMTADEIKTRYEDSFGESEAIGRFEMIERLLDKLQSEMGVSSRS
jgi:predicted RNase H-like HicB family nuclease